MEWSSRESSSSSILRRSAVSFLLKTAVELSVPPSVKYSSISLFSDRFFPSIISSSHSNSHNKWGLLYPIRQSNLHLFALISLWISTKFHSLARLRSLGTLKSIADSHIPDEHFTRSDFIEAEILFLQTLNFDSRGLGLSGSSLFGVVEEVMVKLMEVAKVGEMVSKDTCWDVMDLVYEDEGLARLLGEETVCVGAAVVVVAYVISVPKQRWEFPIVAWLEFVTGCKESQIVGVVEHILQHVLLPSAQSKQ